MSHEHRSGVATVGEMATSDQDRLIGEFFRRLAELEKLADEITARLAQSQPLSGAPPFELITVCTGNRVRSPAAEGFLGQLTAGLPVRLSSVGTLDLGPVPALPEALEAAAALGLDISAHQARCIDAVDLGNADLVLGFERRHVAAAVVDAGAPRERTFTILELVDLLERIDPPSERDPAERAREAIARAQALRRSPRELVLEELPDPLGGSADVFRETVTRVRDLCERLAVGLFGERAVTRLPVIEMDGNGARRQRRGIVGLMRGE